jgi:hypothetical protein
MYHAFFIFIQNVLQEEEEKCGTLHDFACHPCAEEGGAGERADGQIQGLEAHAHAQVIEIS